MLPPGGLGNVSNNMSNRLLFSATKPLVAMVLGHTDRTATVWWDGTGRPLVDDIAFSIWIVAEKTASKLKMACILI